MLGVEEMNLGARRKSFVALCEDVSFFSIELGPITWVYSSGIFPLRLRAQGSSLAISVNRLVRGMVSMTFLTISEKITFRGMDYDDGYDFLLCVYAGDQRQKNIGRNGNTF
ncbi:putative polyol transporter 6 [Glycine soja]